MAKSNNGHLAGSPRGGWDVKSPNATRASAHVGTHAVAEIRAQQDHAVSSGGGVRIHDWQGQIRDSKTVLPDNDLNPPRDRKHREGAAGVLEDLGEVP